MSKQPEIDLGQIFQGNAALHIQIPKWLTTAGRPVHCFYSTMKLWDRLSTQVQELAHPVQLRQIFPLLKNHAHRFPEIVGFCEARPEMLTMLKNALIGMTYGCMKENQDELSVIRYHYALDTPFNLLSVPDSQRCRRPEFVTENGQVEKALASTIQNIFKIILDQMRSEGRNDHVDYMIYACTHFAHDDSNYSKAGKKAISQAFKDFYASMPPDERSEVTHSNFYTQNKSTRFLIDRLVMEVRSDLALKRCPLTLPDRKAG